MVQQIQHIDMKNIFTDQEEVPDAWIYKFYCKQFHREINQPFDGRVIKTHSFKNRDTNASLCFFYKQDTQKYYWKDFSTGQGGNPIQFVAHIMNLEYPVALQMVLNDYGKFIEKGGNEEEYQVDRSTVERVCSYTAKERRWDLNVDKNFWMRYGISLDTLTHFNVRPLSEYTIHINKSNIDFGGHCYGYYSMRYGLYQIYQPYNFRHKYLNNRTDYIIGWDQLKQKSKTLVIVSGLKDLMALHELQLDIEMVAPKSENTLFSSKQITEFEIMYDNIVTLLDNDKAGIQAMMNYKRLYDLPMIHANLEQDLAKNSEKHNREFLKSYYTVLIDKQINKQNGARTSSQCSKPAGICL